MMVMAMMMTVMAVMVMVMMVMMMMMMMVGVMMAIVMMMMAMVSLPGASSALSFDMEKFEDLLKSVKKESALLDGLLATFAKHS